MAIKGKRKSKQSARRPPGAPRTFVVPQKRIRWYQTKSARISAAGVGIALILVVAFLSKNAQDRAAELERQQAALEEVTAQLDAATQSIAPVVSEVVAGNEGTKGLERKVDAWIETLDGTQARLAQGSGGPEATFPIRLALQALLQYRSAAETLRLLIDAPEKLYGGILDRKVGQISAGDGTWQIAVSLLDKERKEAEMGSSGLGLPRAQNTTGG